MARSLTLSDKSASSILRARDRRQEALARALSRGFQATIFLSLNIPGPEKIPSGSKDLFLWALEKLQECFPDVTTYKKCSDALGHYSIMGVDRSPIEVKEHCMGLEIRNPSARLIDLDVYSANGVQIDRKSLDFPARPCLVCREDAVECMRLQRHLLNEVISKAHELLARFKP
jgi:holo-ACP synthase